MIARYIMGAVAVILLSCPAVLAAEQERICSREDLAGTYALMDLHEVPHGREAAAYENFPYYYLRFSQDGSYAYVGVPRRLDTPAEAQKALGWAEKSHHMLTFTLDKAGVLNLYTDKKNDYSYRCFIINEPYDRYGKGDVVLMTYTREKTQLTKTYRRWF